MLLAAPLRTNAQASQQSFSRVSANAYGTVLDSCGVTQTAVTLSTFDTTNSRNASDTTASVVVYRVDSCKHSSVFAYGSSPGCDFTVSTASGSQLPESLTVSGTIPLRVFASSGNGRDPATFTVALHLVPALLERGNASPLTAARNGLYDYNVDATGEMTLPALGLRLFPLSNGQVKFER